MRDGVVYTDDILFTRKFGRRYPQLFDPQNGFADIAKVNKSNKSVIIKRPNVKIVPIPGRKKAKFRFYKIF